MEYVKTLIDNAAKVCGGDQALADRLGIARPNVSLMRAGKRALSPATAAELADIAGEDARQAAIDAVIESARGTRREGVLREILGKGLAAGVAGVLAISYSAGLFKRYRLPTSPGSCVTLQSRPSLAATIGFQGFGALPAVDHSILLRKIKRSWFGALLIF